MIRVSDPFPGNTLNTYNAVPPLCLPHGYMAPLVVLTCAASSHSASVAPAYSDSRAH